MPQDIYPPDNALAFLKADLGFFDSKIPDSLESYLQGKNRLWKCALV